jgi:hypothetical protein
MNDALDQPLAEPAEAEQTPTASRGTRIFTGQLFRVRDGHGWTFSTEPPAAPREPVRRPARVARMLALAHRLQAGIDRGDYRNRAELARQLGFTRARVTQLLDLLLLSPDVAERVLFLEAVDGAEPLTERALRALVRCETWAEQRRAWARLDPQTGSCGRGA